MFGYYVDVQVLLVYRDVQSAAEAFATSLVDKLHAMREIRGRQTWKAILESSNNRAQITRFLKEIQEQTTTFQVSGCSIPFVLN